MVTSFPETVEIVVTGQSDVDVSYAIVSMLVLFIESVYLFQNLRKSPYVYPARVVLFSLAWSIRQGKGKLTRPQQWLAQLSQ